MLHAAARGEEIARHRLRFARVEGFAVVALGGRDGIFQVWNPETWAARIAKLPGIVARHGETMRARSLPSVASGKGVVRD